MISYEHSQCKVIILIRTITASGPYILLLVLLLVVTSVSCPLLVPLSSSSPSSGPTSPSSNPPRPFTCPANDVAGPLPPPFGLFGNKYDAGREEFWLRLLPEECKGELDGREGRA